MSDTMQKAKQAIMRAWFLACQKYGINDSYIDNLLKETNIGEFLESVGWNDDEWSTAIQSAIVSYSDYIDKKTFDAFNKVSAKGFIIGTICFANNGPDDNSFETPGDFRNVYLATLIAFIAGTEGADNPPAMVARLLNEIAGSEKLAVALNNIEWNVKVHDHTQALIQSLKEAGAKHTLH